MSERLWAGGRMVICVLVVLSTALVVVGVKAGALSESTAARGTTYYVSTTGSDGNPGTYAAP